MPQLDPKSTLFFLCDIQTKFRPAIYSYDHVINTTNKLVALAKILGIEVVATTQNAKALGPIDPAIDLTSLGPLLLGPYDKKLFSMVTPEVEALLNARPRIKSVVIFGIESHICVTQTVLSLLILPTPVTPYVVADGVSSCNSFEIPVALDRLRSEGAIVTTSESLCFQLVRDASIPEFKTFSSLIKQEKERTSGAGEALVLNSTRGSHPQSESPTPSVKSAM